MLALKLMLLDAADAERKPVVVVVVMPLLWRWLFTDTY